VRTYAEFGSTSELGAQLVMVFSLYNYGKQSVQPVEAGGDGSGDLSLVPGQQLSASQPIRGGGGGGRGVGGAEAGRAPHFHTFETVSHRCTNMRCWEAVTCSGGRIHVTCAAPRHPDKLLDAWGHLRAAHLASRHARAAFSELYRVGDELRVWALELMTQVVVQVLGFDD
jgi:hypothetical protein